MGSDDTFGGSSEHQVFVSLNLVTTVLGSAASLFTILLIHRMKVSTGHVLLVLTMSYLQFLYDITFFFSNVVITYYINVFANFFQLTAGVGGSLVSNWIAFIALYIILYRRKFNIFENYYYILATCLIPGIVPTIIYGIGSIPDDAQNDELIGLAILDIYYYIRLISIALNFFFVFLAFYKINLMSSTTLNKSPQEIAIRTLARRLIFYPIVQAIGRSGYAWYEFEYGLEIDTDDPDTQQYVCLIFLTIVTPLVSIGYLVIFLAMQPRAYEEFLKMLSCTSYQSPTMASLDNRSGGTATASGSGRLRESRQESNRLTQDTFSYYTDGGRESEAGVSEVEIPTVSSKVEADVSMAEFPRPSGATSNIREANNNSSTHTKFSHFEDEELISFIVDNEKVERESESSHRPSLLNFFRQQRGSNLGRTSTLDPTNTPPTPPPTHSGTSIFQRSSSFLTGSITTTITGGSNLLSQFRNRSTSSNAKRRASDNSAPVASGATTTENPLINANANAQMKRRSVNVLNSIDEETGSVAKSRAGSQEPLRGISGDKNKKRGDSADTLISTITSKSAISSQHLSGPLPPPPPPPPLNSTRSPKSYRHGAPSNFYSGRDSDFLADARESVDAFYQQQDGRESGYSEY